MKLIHQRIFLLFLLFLLLFDIHFISYCLLLIDERCAEHTQIRDGQYGFSNLIGKYCGTDFPPEITSKERYLWLHFHSDESIEYSGFTAVYEFIDRNRDGKFSFITICF